MRPAHTSAELGSVRGAMGCFGEVPEGYPAHLSAKVLGGVANRPSPQSPKGILGSPPPLA